MAEDTPGRSAEKSPEDRDEWELTMSSWMHTGSWLPTRQAVLTTVVSMPAPEVYKAVTGVIGYFAGRRPIESETDEDGGGRVRGRFGSGWANMNRTIVEVHVSPRGSAETDVRMRAAAKEGLLNQHSSEKALRRVRDQLALWLGGVEIAAEPTLSRL